MAHLVTYRIAGEETVSLQTCICDDIDAALMQIEHLRNEVGADDVRLYDATEIPIGFRTWYRVEVGDAVHPSVAAADADADAEAAATTLASYADAVADDDDTDAEVELLGRSVESADYDDYDEYEPSPAHLGDAYDVASADAHEHAYELHRDMAAGIRSEPVVTMPETNFGIFSRP